MLDWQIYPSTIPPDWVGQLVQHYTLPSSPLSYSASPRTLPTGIEQNTSVLPVLPREIAIIAQLLWQRGWRDPETLSAFLDPHQYSPTPATALGEELELALDRLERAYYQRDRIAIWGDFDADGLTATAVLLEGLRPWFSSNQLPGDQISGNELPSDQLQVWIPNRLTDNHGLSRSGLDYLASQGCQLIITCDTGSTNLDELRYAQTLGLDVIITDHHALPLEQTPGNPNPAPVPIRPPALAHLNPRTLPPDHPLAHLSGVAVAYKLIEAVAQRLPQAPPTLLEDLLDLVAIGLIADLVTLQGDSRYLAQRGLLKLQELSRPEGRARRPGISFLLERCQRSGDRPTDISFGLGPRINAISRIQGDTRLALELLTSRDEARCRHLAGEAELLNSRRRELQRALLQEAQEKLRSLDLSTTPVLVLSEPGWPVGLLGLVAGQLAQEYQRPVLLLSESGDTARGSLRSPQGLDFYPILSRCASLLDRFGGHPYAAGLSIPTRNIPILTAALNRELRAIDPETTRTTLTADLTLTVSDLGQPLFRALKLLEPYGMGNPAPQILIQNCWFEAITHRNLKDWRGKAIRFIRTRFQIKDASSPQSQTIGFPGIWWGHYADEIPQGSCDVLGELDYNSSDRRYEFRLTALRRATLHPIALHPDRPPILDHRQQPSPPIPAKALVLTQCPSHWQTLRQAIAEAQSRQVPLVLAYDRPYPRSPQILVQQLIGLAKYLDRTQSWARVSAIQAQLDLPDSCLVPAWRALAVCGFGLAFREGLSGEPEVRVEWEKEAIGGAADRADHAAADRADHATVDIADHAAAYIAKSGPKPPEAEVVAAAFQDFVEALEEDQFQRAYFTDVSVETMQRILGVLA